MGKRSYDDRPGRVKRLISDMLELGIVPAAVELDGLVVRIATYQRPSAGPSSPRSPTVTPSSDRPDRLSRESLALETQDRIVRSYRVAARESLARRIRETGETP